MMCQYGRAVMAVAIAEELPEAWLHHTNQCADCQAAKPMIQVLVSLLQVEEARLKILA